MFKIGNFVMGNIPSEVTVMAGRRMVKTIKNTLINVGLLNQNDIVLINTVTNGYSHYTTTYEEYSNFRYEGASTIFGPYQSNAFIQELDKLAISISENKSIPLGVLPSKRSKWVEILRFQPKTYSESFHKRYGKVKDQPKNSYFIGDIVIVSFYASHLNNNFENVDTYFKIQKFENGVWNLYKTDNSLDTTIRYKSNSILKNSLVEIIWETKGDSFGKYRIYFTGFHKLIGKYIPYEGFSNEFHLIFKFKNDEF
jgi:neutral ceramidase